MDHEAIWMLEQEFWTGDAAAAGRLLDTACLMAFPPPGGILAGAEAVRAALDAAPRWEAVRITAPALAVPGEDLRILAYQAEGQRAGAPPYRALCTSTWRHDGAGWRLLQHQQTPLG